MSTHNPWIANELSLYFRIKKSFQWRLANPSSKRYGNLKYLLEVDELEDISFKCFEDITRLSRKGSGPSWRCMSHFDGSMKMDITSSKAASRAMNIAVSNWIKNEYDCRKNHILLNKTIAAELQELNMKGNVYTLFDIIGHLELTVEDKVLLDWKMDFIDDAYAMKALDCSERTLYNRWNKLRERILGNKDLSKLKNITVYTNWMGVKENGVINGTEMVE